MRLNAIAKWSTLGLLSLALLSGPARVPWAQEVVSGTVRFVTNDEDPTSDVSVSNEVGAVFANQQVKLQFDFARSFVTAVSISLVANPVDIEASGIELKPDLTDENGNLVLSCEIGPSGGGALTAVDTCQDIELTDDITTIRVGFSVRYLNQPPGGEPNSARSFNLVAVLSFPEGASQTDPPLSLQIAGEVAVDLGLEGPVVLSPATPQQGDRVTLSFFVVNNDPSNSGSINTLNFELKPPDASGFTDMSFLQLACVVEDRPCDALPLSLNPRERKRVQFQFITSPLSPTPVGQHYLLRLTLNAASRLQEGVTEVAHSNNLFTVNFSLAQPERDLALSITSAAQSYTQGQPAQVDFQIANLTAVPLQDNRLHFSLVVGGIAQDVAFQCTLQDPLAAVSDSCEGFSLFIAEAKAFTLQFSTAPLTAGVVYRLTLAVSGPDGQPAGERSQQSLEFSVLSVEGGGGTTVQPAFGPELRPIELKIVPSATVEVGTAVVLSSTVKNSGNRVAKDVLVSFSFKPEGQEVPFEPLGVVQFFPRLGIGREVEARQAFDTGALPGPGSYRVRVEVHLQDPTAPELDAQNNVLDILMSVVQKQNSSG